MVLVELTDSARAALANLVPRLHVAERTWLSAVRLPEQRTLLKLLESVQASLDQADVEA
jgi:hypothetical protein